MIKVSKESQTTLDAAIGGKIQYKYTFVYVSIQLYPTSPSSNDYMVLFKRSWASRLKETNCDEIFTASIITL
jgi:hypothetical protein